MGQDSKIQWTDHSWNPWHGCQKVSTGCKYCYMYRDKERYNQDPTTVLRSKSNFNAPLKWKEPKLVFTCSWSDWFIEEADAWRPEAWDIIRRTPHLTYQILTKRPERIPQCLPDDWGKGYDNVWLGISAEDSDILQQRAEFFTLNIPAKVRFISVEPLLGSIGSARDYYYLVMMDWVILGGESGNETGDYRYRPMLLSWLQRVVNFCTHSNIPVFVKQLGTYQAKKLGLKDRHGGDMSEWPKDLQIRQFPKYYSYETKEV